jgi:hypothetical protein
MKMLNDSVSVILGQIPDTNELPSLKKELKSNLEKVKYAESGEKFEVTVSLLSDNKFDWFGYERYYIFILIFFARLDPPISKFD